MRAGSVDHAIRRPASGTYELRVNAAGNADIGCPLDDGAAIGEYAELEQLVIVADCRPQHEFIAGYLAVCAQALSKLREIEMTGMLPVRQLHCIAPAQADTAGTGAAVEELKPAVFARRAIAGLGRPRLSAA